jgi:monothiol glutaredoxin
MTEEMKTKIKDLLEKNKVLIFMKGSQEAPQCGFSARAVQCLKNAGAEQIQSVDILADREMYTAIREYTDWPTFPQVFLNGKFVGGADIVTEMSQNGELQKELGFKK